MIGSTAAMTGQKVCGQGVNNGRHIGPFGGKRWSLADSVRIDKEIKGYDYSPESEPKWSTPTNMWDDITDISTNSVVIHQHSIIISMHIFANGCTILKRVYPAGEPFFPNIFRYKYSLRAMHLVYACFQTLIANTDCININM